MSTWTPFRAPRGEQPYYPDPTVRALADGTLLLTHDLVEQLGNPSHVEFLTNGSPQHIGIRPATVILKGRAYRLGNYPPGARVHTARMGNAHQVLRALGRRGAACVLPHSWDDGVLVVDVSGLPERETGGTR
jgi:hypothetical protein